MKRSACLLVAIVAIVALVGFVGVAGAQEQTVWSAGSHHELEIRGVVDMDGQEYHIWWLHFLIDGTMVDWTNTELHIDLAVGSFYQHPLGGDVPASPEDIALYPELAYDTFAAARGVPSGVPGFAKPLPGFGWQHQMDAVGFHANWLDTGDAGVGRHMIAQFALTPDATGTIEGTSYFSGATGGSPIVETVFPPLWVPEPTGLSLLAFGALAVLGRRRR